MGLWLAIYFPRLALESSLPASETPVPGLLLSPGSRVVMQCNDAALSCGIKPDMPVNTAYCLVPHVETVTYDAIQEAHALSQLALMCYRLSAHISMAKSDLLLLEIQSMLALFGGLDAYWQHLQSALNHTGFCFQASTGHTPQTAMILAQSGSAVLTTSLQTHQAALMSLSVDELGLSIKQERRLQSMGIRRYSDISVLSKDDLGYRFGVDFLHVLTAFEQETALGTPFKIPARFDERLEFYTEVVYAKGLIFPLKTVMQTLEHYLHLRQLGAAHLVLTLVHRQGPDTRLVIRAVRGAWRAKEWVELIAIRLDRLVLVAPILACRIQAHQFQHQKPVAADMLGDQPSGMDGDQLLSILVSRLGHNRVNTPTATADPRPEKAGKMASALAQATAHLDQVTRPHPAFLTRMTPCVALSHSVILCGPERIVSGWWDFDWQRSDYYGVTSQSGVFYWLERHNDGRWWQRGLYG